MPMPKILRRDGRYQGVRPINVNRDEALRRAFPDRRFAKTHPTASNPTKPNGRTGFPHDRRLSGRPANEVRLQATWPFGDPDHAPSRPPRSRRREKRPAHQQPDGSTVIPSRQCLEQPHTSLFF